MTNTGERPLRGMCGSPASHPANGDAAASGAWSTLPWGRKVLEGCYKNTGHILRDHGLSRAHAIESWPPFFLGIRFCRVTDSFGFGGRSFFGCLQGSYLLLAVCSV